jgi:hypothetical protein
VDQEIVDSTAQTENLSPAYFPLLDTLDPALIDFSRNALRDQTSSPSAS